MYFFYIMYELRQMQSAFREESAVVVIIKKPACAKVGPAFARVSEGFHPDFTQSCPLGHKAMSNLNPLGIWCQHDVVSTSLRCHHITSTLIGRHFTSCAR